MELSNSWVTVSGMIPGLNGIEANSPLLHGMLWAAEEPGFLSVLLGKIWVYGAVALGVGMVIFVHELGHFLAAKLFGVKVEKFYVGFDVPFSIFGVRLPRSFGRFRWGETEYGIGVIPLGGYVKMLGQDDDPRQAAAERDRIRQANSEADDAIDVPEVTLDPRSYPAKTVWQRMIIISAGVVMNLITSVFFAAIAFGFGVKYQPAVIGQTIAGYPAWEAGLQPGGRIVSAGGIENDPKLHFFDMMGEILKASLDNPTAPVSVTVDYGDEKIDYSLATRESNDELKRRLIGIGVPIEARLNEISPTLPNTAAAKVLTKDHKNAQIVAIDGQALEPNPIVGVPLSDALQRDLIVKRDQPITLTLSKGDGDAQQVTVAPQLYKSVGITFSPGKVAGLVENGPAKKAGVQVGDRIIGFGAEQSGITAVSLPGLAATAEGTVQLKVRRGEGDAAKMIDIAIEPMEPTYASSPLSNASGQVELASLGLSYLPEPVVVSANADVTTLQPGDRLKRLTVEWESDDAAAALADALGNGEKLIETLTDGWEINDSNNLVALIEVLQVLPVGTKVDLKALRGEQQTVIEATGIVSETDQYWYERGMQLSAVSLTHQAESVGEAFALGFRESRRKLGEVFSFLRLLVTGRVGAGNIGGPGAIVTMAGAAATVGITKLLLFLTFLSVNLAVINFLPIPALDGGHMVFLIAEAVRGKPVDEELQAKLTMAGVLALLSLMVFVIINDFINISSMM